MVWGRYKGVIHTALAGACVCQGLVCRQNPILSRTSQSSPFTNIIQIYDFRVNAFVSSFCGWSLGSVERRDSEQRLWSLTGPGQAARRGPARLLGEARPVLVGKAEERSFLGIKFDPYRTFFRRVRDPCHLSYSPVLSDIAGPGLTSCVRHNYLVSLWTAGMGKTLCLQETAYVSG